MKIVLAFLMIISSVPAARAAAATGALRVEVTDAATGAAISGASVRVSTGQTGVSAADGAAAVSDVPAAQPYRAVDVTVEAAGYDRAVWKDAEIYPDNTTILPLGMTRTGRTQVVQEPPHALETPGPGMNAGEPAIPLTPPVGNGMSALGPLPLYIRVWRVAKSDQAGRTIVENILFEDYVKGVVPSEWFPSWDQESLKAGCVAARSYGWYKVLHPRYPDIGADVSDTTATQVYRDSRQDSTNRAADATRGQVITYNGTVINAEYSAENSDPTTAGPFPYQPSVSDPVCAGQPRNGHGRGLCQWGSQRWATGAPGSNGGKTYDWILNHYYGSAAQLQTAGGGLDVGDCAAVEGGQASVRQSANGPGLTLLAPGTLVHIMEGPTLVNGVNWWRIAWPMPAPTRSDGWVADTWLVETVCPPATVAITNIFVADITPTGGSVQWKTNVEATSVVRYGRSAGTLPFSVTGAPGTQHSVPLTGLLPGATYFYQVQSAAEGYTPSTSVVRNFNTAMPNGDVNNDGAVTLADAAQALRIAAGIESADADTVGRADVYGWDRRITLEDALTTLQIAVAAGG